MAIREFKYMAPDIRKFTNEVNSFLDRDMPEIIGVESTNHFKTSFQQEGFTNTSLNKWQPRKVSSMSQKQLLQSSGRAILTGLANKAGTHLKDSIFYRTLRRRTIIYSPKVYAGVHNEGLRAGRGSGFIMPKRQFIGQSDVLDKHIGRKITLFLDTIFKR